MTVEVCYLNLEWKGKGELKSAKKGASCKVVPLSENEYEVETYTYPERYGGNYVGISFGNENSKPFCVNTNNDLKPVNIGSKTWWFLSEGWSKHDELEKSPPHGTVARFEIADKASQQLLHIVNNSTNFRVEELESALSSIKEDLKFVLCNSSADSYVWITKQGKEILDLKLVGAFFKQIQKILINPAKGLKETTGKVPRNRVKPTARTFVDELRGANRKYLDGRKHEETFDTPENQYIRFFVHNVSLLLSEYRNYLSNNIKKLKEDIKANRRKESYEKQSVLRNLTREEQDEVDKKNVELKKRVRSLESQISRQKNFLKYCEPLLKQSYQLKSRMKELCIRSSRKINPAFSTKFIFNSNYSNARKLYEKIISDENSLGFIREIQKMGVHYIPELYERWCLLKLLNVIEEDFKFCLEPNWKAALRENILKRNEKNKVPLKISAIKENKTEKGASSRIQIDICYEKMLTTGKVPDFVLDFICTEYEYSKTSKRWISKESKKPVRMVLDAKFKPNDIPEKELLRILDELYGQGEQIDSEKGKIKRKDYSEGGHNRVFILHPCKDRIENPTSNLIWGKSCDYGGSHPNDHKKGHIFVSPLQREDTIMNLKRLIGLQLQEVSRIPSITADTEVNKDTAGIFSNLVSSGDIALNYQCIYCGSPSVKIAPRETSASKTKWYITCQKCGGFTVQSFCHSCGRTLFKNGNIWTYHNNLPGNIISIICPACGASL